MGSLGVVIHHVFRQLFPKDPFVVYGVQIGIDKLVLNGAVVPLDVSVNLGAPGVDEIMGNTVFFRVKYSLIPSITLSTESELM